ncbi:CapA family protein [uncultured Bacteroides sp.]|uniref:CapA family protein n=1 Tax=uncultured Bacteroides sp. TaxID=162156 RepID=UPI002AA75D3C|nr:CapA family protein [uncultured Bacteroides sp.]
MRTIFFPLSILLLSCFFGPVLQEKETIRTDSDSIVSSKITLLFVGDLMQHQGQIEAARTASGYDYSECFKLVKEEISKADVAIGNLEVTLGGEPYSGYPQFSAPDEYLSAIKEAGFDVLLTANNHCLDRRKTGLERTILMLDSLHIPHVGTYVDQKSRNTHYPLLLEIKGFRIVLLNYTFGTNGIHVSSPNTVNYIDKSIMSSDIKAARSLMPDAIIACMHWGEEYKQLPNKEQTSLANWLLEQGVTHIIGSHPHVVQPIEIRTDSVSGNKHAIVYSLGNFISNMSAPNTDGGLIFKLELTKDSVTTYASNYSYDLVWTARPVLTQKKNHILIFVNDSINWLPPAARNRLNIFAKSARSLFNRYNQGINEYFPE